MLVILCNICSSTARRKPGVGWMGGRCSIVVLRSINGEKNIINVMGISSHSIHGNEGKLRGAKMHSVPCTHFSQALKIPHESLSAH